MLLYRITKEKYLNNFTGKGKSYLDGARWNKAGQATLYFASTPSVALLEMANYLPSPRLVPADYRMGIYALPDTISKEILTVETLPNNWADYPYPSSTQEIGSQWWESQASLCLIVPSTATPQGLENIIAVNPLHSEISSLKLVRAIEDLYNKRAFQGL